MEENYNNETGNANSGVSGSRENGNGPERQQGYYVQPSAQPNVQEQLRYQYQPPYQETEVPMTLGDWMITLLLLAIPVVNLILLFVWGFGSNTKKSKANFCRATLIYMAIAIVLWILLIVVIGVAVASMY